MTRSPSFRNKSRQCWLAWLCVLCLLGMQGLGQWHGIAHGSKLNALPTTTLSQASDTLKITEGWGHQSGDADCHVFDHLSHDQWLNGSVTLDCAAAAHLKAPAPVWAGAELAARWKRGARAPPLFA